MLTRRRLLAGGLALPVVGVVAACSASAAPLPPSADELARDAARADEQSLLDLYTATLAAHPQLTGRLAPLRDHHTEHLASLAPPPTTVSPSASASPPGPAPTVPTDPDEALRAVVKAETGAGEDRAGQVLAAGDDLAVLLASICAAERAHAMFLAGTTGTSS